MSNRLKTGLLWGKASFMWLVCSALWAAQPLDEAGLPINAGMAGSWANAEIPGQGLFIDVDPAARTVFLAWFTWKDTPQGSGATVGNVANRWFVALGNYPESSSDVEMALLETSGGVFDQTGEVLEVEVGTLTLHFHDCESAQMDFVIDDETITGTVELMRLTPADTCEALTNP